MGLYIGLMSGTSADSIDAAVIEISAPCAPTLLATHREALPSPIREQILALFSNQPVLPRTIGELDTRLGRLFAKSARAVLRAAHIPARSVTAIGSHGQTVFHAPEGRFPFTLQLGDANIIAEMTGIVTVADFRRRDMAVGGHGAPLAPAFHAYALRAETESRVIVNLGGIANITILPASATGRSTIRGFDTGPANALLDAWTCRELGQSMDANGAWSRSGVVDPLLLDHLLADCYFAKEPPKSTGREAFGVDWLLARLASVTPNIKAVNVASTLCELTTETIARAIERWAGDVDAVLACGGGVNNGYLMERLAAKLEPIRLTTTDSAGIPPAWVECMAFGWLAHRTLDGLSGNIPSVTGARREVVLGSIHAAPIGRRR